MRITLLTCISRIAFPAIYQALFTYFLLLSWKTHFSSLLAVSLLGAVGILLTASMNLRFVLSPARSAGRRLLTAPLLNMMFLPAVQFLAATLLS